METLKTIALRKFVRNFMPQQIPNAALNTILAAGCAAPVAGGAYQNFHITVVQNTRILEHMQELSQQLGCEFSLYGAPGLIVVSAAESGQSTDSLISGGCIVQNIMLAATDLSLGSVWVQSVTELAKRSVDVQKTIGIPQGFEPIVSIAMGYPAVPLLRYVEESLYGENMLEERITITRH